MSTFFKGFKKNWLAFEAAPILVITSAAAAGASWYLYRLAMGPTTQWTNTNPQPWNNIKPNQGTKIMSVNQKFEESWSRGKL